MLTPEEENKLKYLKLIIEASKTESNYPQFGAYDIEWLADKLKEVNEEFKNVNCNCPKTTLGTPPALHKCPKCGFESGYDNVHYRCVGCEENKRRKLYSPKNEISDRRYPR